MNESKYRVLLVDDEPNLRKVLSALLIQQGFAVHVENDGEAALTREGGLAVVLHVHGEALLNQQGAEDLPQVWLVVHEQDSIF